MAQNFVRYKYSAIGTTAQTLITADSNDTIVGISLANITGSSVTASAYITSGGTDYYLIKNAPIPAGSSLQILDGGAKFVVQSGDVLKIVSNTASSVDAWISAVDDISA